MGGGGSLVEVPVQFRFRLRVGHMHSPVLASAVGPTRRRLSLWGWFRRSTELLVQLRGQRTVCCPVLSDTVADVTPSRQKYWPWRKDVSERRVCRRCPRGSPPFEAHGGRRPTADALQVVLR